VGSYELLVWLIRTSGWLEGEPSAEFHGEDKARHAAASSVPSAVTDSVKHRGSNRDSSAQDQWLKDRPAGQTVALTGARHDNGTPGATVDNDASVAAYRLSVEAGNPLSERKLAQMFGRTSRRWARARIADARQLPDACDLLPDL
jgi:hypothetical protein